MTPPFGKNNVFVLILCWVSRHADAFHWLHPHGLVTKRARRFGDSRFVSLARLFDTSLNVEASNNYNGSSNNDNNDANPKHYPTKPADTVITSSKSRRDFLSASLAGVASSFAVMPLLPSHAGEVGAKITKAVTQSDIGISVRTSVVKGAQIMDQIDGQWERFSDQWGLGAERSKRPGRPTPKVIPDPLPLDVPTANAMLQAADETFLSIMTSNNNNINIKAEQLNAQINKVAELVRPSFERSSKRGEPSFIDLGSNLGDIKTAAQFNFASYVHFKVFSDLILQQGKTFDFNSFRRNFEAQFGQRLVALLLPQQSASSNNGSTKQEPKTEQLLNSKLQQIDQLCEVLKEKGLISLSERSPLDKDQVADWFEDVSDLTFTVALDGDITLGSQMLLQEQGFRLYPDYARFAVLALFQGIKGQEAQIEDYYFDTDYNSDPDKFEVKEVVLNVVLDST